MNINYFLVSSMVASSAFLGASSACAATPDIVTPGVSFSVKICCGPGGGAVGFGPAVNYAHWLDTSSGSLATVGAFGWLHYYPALDAMRIGVGPQASYYFGGLELGPSAFFQKGESTSVQASLTPFGSIGFVWTGIRLNLGAEAKNPFAEFVFGAGYPVMLGRQSGGFFDFGSGRPIRVRGERRTAGTRADAHYGMNVHPALPRSRSARRALAKAWQRDAELEYSSIAAFEHLAGQLAARGAPDALVGRCLAAARDESKHARMCYGLASAYGARRCGPRPLDLRDLDLDQTLAELVFETVIDGCLGEAIAAAEARARLATERDPVVQRILRAIVRDEAAHARLAWRVAEWGGEREALVLALERIEKGAAATETAARVQRRVVRRLRRMIATLPIRRAA
ncbi:MAG: hypothetical protein ABIP89_07690 [Polyangiaceae bacterium]